MRTLGQERATYCLEQLKGIGCNRGDFKNFSAGLPSMILQNGFGQTLAFLLAKGKGEDKHIVAFRIIVGWLENKNLLERKGSELESVTQISELDQNRYLAAQKETLAMLEWLKRYANAALFEEGS